MNTAGIPGYVLEQDSFYAFHKVRLANALRFSVWVSRDFLRDLSRAAGWLAAHSRCSISPFGLCSYVTCNCLCPSAVPFCVSLSTPSGVRRVPMREHAGRTNAGPRLCCTLHANVGHLRRGTLRNTRVRLANGSAAQGRQMRHARRRFTRTSPSCPTLFLHSRFSSLAPTPRRQNPVPTPTPSPGLRPHDVDNGAGCAARVLVRPRLFRSLTAS